jgi:lysozyme
MNRKAFLVAWLCLFIVLFPKTPLIIESKIMSIAESTINIIVNFEGKRNRAYKDSRGLWTIGVGHLIKPNEKHLITAELTDKEVHELLRHDLNQCDEAVTSSVRVPLTQNQYDALYSLCFNIGPNGFKTSTIVRRLNQGDYRGAAEHFMDWIYPSELIGRRKKEKALFLTDI